MGLNVSIALSDSASRYPDRPALYIGESVVTYRELDIASNRAANALTRFGVSHGQVVALLLPNGLNFVVAYFGALKAGATIVPLNILLRAGELRHCLRDSGASVLMAGAAQAATAVTAAGELGIKHVYVAGEKAVPGSGGTLDALLAAAPATPCRTDTDPGATAVLLYTSGTTGQPKGARLTHSGLLWVASTIATRTLAMTSSDVVLQALPLSHIFGLNALLNMAFLSGAAIVLEGRFDPERGLALAKRHGVTVFAGVPTMAIGLLSAAEGHEGQAPSLRIALLGGQSVPPEVRRRFAEVFGCVTIESYGLTEFASAVAATPSGRLAKTGSVGSPVWGAEVLIQGESGAACPPGEIGEILVRGVGLMTGYHNQPDATEQVLRDGWFHTGDLGLLDSDGDLFIVDRKKDMIIRGGYNIYPREVEDVLYEHPAVLEVAVVGVPHPRLGEEVAAAVRLRPGMMASADELRAFTRERLAAYKYPRLVAFVDSLPKSTSGKLLKRSIDIEELASRARLSES